MAIFMQEDESESCRRARPRVVIIYLIYIVCTGLIVYYSYSAIEDAKKGTLKYAVIGLLPLNALQVAAAILAWKRYVEITNMKTNIFITLL